MAGRPNHARRRGSEFIWQNLVVHLKCDPADLNLQNLAQYIQKQSKAARFALRSTPRPAAANVYSAAARELTKTVKAVLTRAWGAASRAGHCQQPARQRPKSVAFGTGRVYATQALSKPSHSPETLKLNRHTKILLPIRVNWQWRVR